MPYRSAILAAIEDLKDHQTGSPISSIRNHIRDQDTTSSSSDNNDSPWNETLFQKTLKTLVEKGDLLQLSGTNYKFSQSYLEKRAEILQSRVDSIHEHLAKIHSAASPTNHFHAREEPPKEVPKKKTVHAKVKINEGKIITVVNPESKSKSKNGGEEMDITPEESGGVEDVDLVDGSKRGSPHKKHHVKIIPRKVVVKKM